MTAEEIPAVDDGLQIVQPAPGDHGLAQGMDLAVVVEHLYIPDGGQRKLEPFPFRVNGEGSQALRQMLQAPVQGACHILLPEGLYQVVGGPCLKAFHAVIHAGGGIDNGHIASRGPEPPGRLNPGQTGHKDIEKNKLVELRLTAGVQQLLPAGK